jgi:hypothetical protein
MHSELTDMFGILGRYSAQCLPEHAGVIPKGVSAMWLPFGRGRFSFVTDLGGVHT